MPNVKEIEQIFMQTPIDQPILLKGGHGIGKSQIITQIGRNIGCNRVVTLFLGQAADAGDIIGLPTRISTVINGEETFVTDFAPPKWWPRDMDESLIIFLDELNRGKPEIMQCVMDMVLNRKLNGRDLPPKTRIVGAMNPIDDGYYQVEDLDPAFVDRWNIYDFTPSVEEWCDWAFENKVNPLVRTFILHHNDHLDPPNSKDTKAQDVNPSRRSWVRISDTLNNNPGLLEAKNIGNLVNILLGVVGTRSTSAFRKFVKEIKHNLTPADILENWTEDIQKSVSALQILDTMQINQNIEYYFKEKFDTLKKKKELATLISKNLQSYLETISPEVAADFFERLSKANNAKEQWPNMVVSTNSQLAKKFIKVMRGEDVDE